jgi:superfamily II DNA or RNA helicase
MALRLKPVRMLIADDVGIGKTIEACLIARELLDRGQVNRLAVLCPPHLCDQWHKELSEKFNIEAKIVRTNTLARLERELPSQNLSVFQYYSHLILSIDFVKSERRKNAFIVHSPDLIIVDEAHGCARPPGHAVTQQQRNQFVTELAKNKSKNLVLVTATPHSGVEESFLSLLGFIRPYFGQRDLERLEYNERADLARHFIQRRRADVKQWMGTETKFPKRLSFEVSFKLSNKYQIFFRNVHKFASGIVIDEKGEKGYKKRVKYWAALALLRCVMSSPAAAKAALMSRLGVDTEEELHENIDYSTYVLDPTEREFNEDIVPSHVVKDSEVALANSEIRKLREFARISDSLKGRNDYKVKRAADEVNSLLKEGFKPIVFCRFIATSDYVASELKKRLKKDFPGIHVISVTGSLSEEEREIRITDLIGSKKYVLVATDCLSEGINLQEGFNAVLHYDLPWNPNRLEQREGRVDRFGQESKQVKAILLYGADNPIDGAVLDVLLRKAKHIHNSLGITVPIPTKSDTLMETVLKALFLYGVEGDQLGLFGYGDEVEEVHKKWDRSVERERKSRTLFAQHAIKPGEVSQELEIVDSILGDTKDIENFIKTTCQRIGVTVTKTKKYWRLSLSQLPLSIRSKLTDKDELKFTLDLPKPEDVEYISRNHPLVRTLAEYIFDNAFQEGGNKAIASRVSVIRTEEVDKVTTLLLLRYRFRLRGNGGGSISIAEKCLIAGFEGMIGSESWMKKKDAEKIFKEVTPSSSLAENDKRYWADEILKEFNSFDNKLEDLAIEVAEEISESYKRVRKTIKGEKTEVIPSLPADVISISILLPEIKM